MYQEIFNDLQQVSSAKKASFLARYFQTGPGEYGEGDRFMGVTVPLQRTIAKKHWSDTSFDDLHRLLRSEWHEVRVTALMILHEMFRHAEVESAQEEVVDFYLKHLDRVNNWDLVDISAAGILGEWLVDKDHDVLYELAKSGHLWSERVSIVATFAFVKRKQYGDSLRLAEHFLTHKHDLMHKAVGWVLRDVGDKDRDVLRGFLNEHAHHMPRTTLRYCLEHFDAVERKEYMEMKARKKAAG